MARLKTFNNRKRRKLKRTEFFWHTDPSHYAGWKMWELKGGQWARYTPRNHAGK